MIVFKNILVATDFEEPSGAALDYGRDLARSYGSTLHVVHVTQNVLARFTAESAFVLLADLQAAVETDARERMDAIITTRDRTSLRAKVAVITAVDTADAIVQYADDHHIDLIVMGTHGRRGMTHLLLGSVAERVVRTAPCAVLTVRQPRCEIVAPDALVAAVNA
jgi:nucleotide-binding universal stress UspA family protein